MGLPGRAFPSYNGTMSATGQPTAGGADASRRAPAGLRLAEVLFGLLLLAGIAVFAVSRRPRYSDDPRLDRAARALAAFVGPGFVKGPTGLRAVFGRQTVPPGTMPQSWNRLVWVVFSLEDGLPGAPSEEGRAEHAWIGTMAFLKVDARHASALVYALGGPWVVRASPGKKLPYLYGLNTAPLPDGDAAPLGRRLQAVREAPTWEEAGAVLAGTHGLTEEQTDCLRAGLLRRALADTLFENLDRYAPAAAALLRAVQDKSIEPPRLPEWQFVDADLLPAQEEPVGVRGLA